MPAARGENSVTFVPRSRCRRNCVCTLSRNWSSLILMPDGGGDFAGSDKADLSLAIVADFFRLGRVMAVAVNDELLGPGPLLPFREGAAATRERKGGRASDPIPPCQHGEFPMVRLPSRLRGRVRCVALRRRDWAAARAAGRAFCAQLASTGRRAKASRRQKTSYACSARPSAGSR